jgi:hypothetical protein
VFRVIQMIRQKAAGLGWYQQPRHTGPRVRPMAGPRTGSSRRPWLTWIPACERVKKCQTSSFRGAGTAREPGTHEHRASNILEIQVFLGSGLGPSGRPGMTFLGKNNFFTRSFAGKAIDGNRGGSSE